MSGMTEEHGISIRGNEPRSDVERRKRELFLGYLGAALRPEEMKSRFAPGFWPHDLIPGDQRPPESAGTEAMTRFREVINGAFPTVRSGTGTWIEDDAELSELAGGAEPGDLVGASMVVTYVHEGGPLTLPGVDRVYEPSGNDVVVEVADVVRVDNDGKVTDRWNRFNWPEFIRQLGQNLSS
jgi:hypothetical protein